MKVCRKCGLQKDDNGFHKSNHTKDGLQRWCKTCISAYGKVYGQSYRERRKLRWAKVEKIAKAWV